MSDNTDNPFPVSFTTPDQVFMEDFLSQGRGAPPRKMTALIFKKKTTLQKIK